MAAALEDRLEHIRRLLKERKVYWSAYNPQSPYLFDVEDAGDDVRWLVAEVERLRGKAKPLSDPPKPGR